MTDEPNNPFTDLGDGDICHLPAGDRFAEAAHLWAQPEIDALILAWAAGRPLLVRGEAGSGKSQIARAAAVHLGQAAPLVEVIHPRFEAQDLKYRYDLVARLADAQVAGELDPTNEKYVSSGVLWKALEPETDAFAAPVLLIDEIDKADSDLPNALLDVLGNRSFDVPPLKDRVVHAKGGRMPLVVVTTNEERELPAAFVRRCVVLNVNPPAAPRFVDWLMVRGRVHSHLKVVEEARLQAARQVAADRLAAEGAGFPGVGLAEYVDLLTALHDLTPRHMPLEDQVNCQLEWVDRLSAYALVKHPGQPQDRLAEPRVAGPAAPDAP